MRLLCGVKCGPALHLGRVHRRVARCTATEAREWWPAAEQPATEELAPEQKKEKAKQAKLAEKAKRSAVGSLNMRSHSRGELQAKLLQKGYSSEHTDGALAFVDEQNMLNDRRHAQLFAMSKWRQSCWAPGKIAQEMRAKGISEADSNAGLVAVFGHAHRDLGAAKEFEFALQDLPLLTAEQLQQGYGEPDKLAKRLEAWLLARQHSYTVIRLVTDYLREHDAR